MVYTSNGALRTGYRITLRVMCRDRWFPMRGGKCRTRYDGVLKRLPQRRVRASVGRLTHFEDTIPTCGPGYRERS